MPVQKKVINVFTNYQGIKINTTFEESDNFTYYFSLTGTRN